MFFDILINMFFNYQLNLKRKLYKQLTVFRQIFNDVQKLNRIKCKLFDLLLIIITLINNL